MFQIEARQILTPERWQDNPLMTIEEGKVVALGGVEIDSAEEVNHAPEFTLVPGFVEAQINGAFGIDFTAQPDAIWRVGARLPELGITTFLPTIITSPPETVRAALQTWQAGAPAGYRGAQIPGLHLEGPFLNPAKKGAHREVFFRKPALSEVTDWTPENGVRLVTLAPELPGALAVARSLRERGVVVSAGHSMASAQVARAGIAAGIRMGTHPLTPCRRCITASRGWWGHC